MDLNEMLGELDRLNERRRDLNRRLDTANVGDLRRAQLADDLVTTWRQERDLWNDLVEGRIEMDAWICGRDTGVMVRLLMRAAYARIDTCERKHASAQARARRLRQAARDVREQGEAAFADTGMEYRPGTGVVRR